MVIVLAIVGYETLVGGHSATPHSLPVTLQYVAISLTVMQPITHNVTKGPLNYFLHFSFFLILVHIFVVYNRDISVIKFHSYQTIRKSFYFLRLFSMSNLCTDLTKYKVVFKSTN